MDNVSFQTTLFYTLYMEYASIFLLLLTSRDVHYNPFKNHIDILKGILNKVYNN